MSQMNNQEFNRSWYLIFVPESSFKICDDDVDVLEEGAEVDDGQLAQVLQRDVPNVVVDVKVWWKRPENQ